MRTSFTGPNRSIQSLNEGQATAKALGLLVPEIADVEGRVFELSFELRPARFLHGRDQASKHGLKV